MTHITLITPGQVISLNHKVCAQQQQNHVCANPGKVESAVATAFYPGSYPFQHGGIAKMAGALCYYLTKAHAFFDGNKRTAGIAASTLMLLNGYDLTYTIDEKKNHNAFAEIIDNCAASIKSKEDVMAWFECHKKPIPHSSKN